jgi:hypothetical protein
MTQLYEKPVRLLMRDMVTNLGLKQGETLTKERVISWFAQKYPKVKEGSITAHLIRASTNAPSRVHYNNVKGDDDLLFQIDGSRFRLFEPATDPAPIYEKGQGQISQTAEPADDQESPSEFAYEDDLRKFIVKNPAVLELGLKIYQDEDKDVTGVQFPVGGRFIDILGVDAKNNLVVVELKVSRGYDRVVGQLLRYMAWIKIHQAEPGQTVRGIIVAREISEDLLLACSTLPDVELFNYRLAVTLQKVQLESGKPTS